MLVKSSVSSCKENECKVSHGGCAKSKSISNGSPYNNSESQNEGVVESVLEEVNKLSSDQYNKSEEVRRSNGVCSEELKKCISEESQISAKAMVELFEVVNASGLPNFKGCRLPVPSSKKFVA